MIKRSVVCLLASLTIAVLPAAAQDRRYVAGEIEGGARLYQSNCVGCHGPEGDGVSGINFSKSQYRRAASDDELVRIIVRGIPGTAMPPSSFSEGQVTTIVAYLRSMTASSAPIGTTQGDPRRGQAVFEGKGQCLSCHSVNGNGSRVATNLTEIGGVRRVAELERSLVEPGAEVRAENRTIRAVRRDGTALSGRLLNQDTFSIQFLDQNERLVSTDKASLREITIEKTSPMPSYLEKLSLQEIADVVSYLTTLRGRQ